MLYVRYKLGVVTYCDIVIAMGGKNDPKTVHDSIEIMNFRCHSEWKEVSLCLPVPMWNIKPTLSRKNVIIMGYSHAMARNNGSYEIPVASFMGQPQSTKQWNELCPAPYHNTATIPYSNPPVLLGGSTAGIATSQIMIYDELFDNWRQIDSLTSAKGNVGVSLISNSTLIVIGGTNGGVGVKESLLQSLSTVEIGHLIQQKITK